MKKQQQLTLMRPIKIINIGFLTIIYTILAFILSTITDKILGPWDLEKELKKPKWKRIVELIILLWIISVLLYMLYNVITIILFPFDKYQVQYLYVYMIFSYLFLGQFFGQRMLSLYDTIFV